MGSACTIHSFTSHECLRNYRKIFGTPHLRLCGWEMAQQCVSRRQKPKHSHTHCIASIQMCARCTLNLVDTVMLRTVLFLRRNFVLLLDSICCAQHVTKQMSSRRDKRACTSHEDIGDDAKNVWKYGTELQPKAGIGYFIGTHLTIVCNSLYSTCRELRARSCQELGMQNSLDLFSTFVNLQCRDRV